jgi:hypothetical protein
MHIQ